MITRREFIKKSGIALSMIVGAEQIISASGKLISVSNNEFTIKTNLKFLDIPLIKETLYNIDNFGSREQYHESTGSFYIEGMDILDYVENYLKQAKDKLSINNETSLNEIPSIAISNDMYLALISSLIILMGDIAFKVEANSMQFSYTIESAKEAQNEVNDIAHELEKICNSWSIGDIKFVSDRKNSKLQYITVNNDKNYLKADYVPLCYECIFENINQLLVEIKILQLHDSRAFVVYLRSLEVYLINIALERARWKKHFSSFSVLNLFKKQYSAINNHDEKIYNKIEIVSGTQHFIEKLLLGYFFAELILNRVMLLAYQGISGIYNFGDRFYLDIEICGLIEAIAQITKEILFDNEPIFPEKENKTVTVSNNDNKYELEIIALNPDIPIQKPEAYRYYEFFRTEQIKESADKYIEKIKSSRSKIYEALKEL